MSSYISGMPEPKSAQRPFIASFQPGLPALLNIGQRTQLVLDAINLQLSTRVMRSYGAFVHGMAQVQLLESDLVLTAILCRSARRHLGRVQGTLVHGGLRLLSCMRRRGVTETVASTLCTITALSAGLAMLEKQLKVRAASEQWAAGAGRGGALTGDGALKSPCAASGRRSCTARGSRPAEALHLSAR